MKRAMALKVAAFQKARKERAADERRHEALIRTYQATGIANSLALSDRLEQMNRIHPVSMPKKRLYERLLGVRLL
jgi:hypothetical protein